VPLPVAHDQVNEWMSGPHNGSLEVSFENVRRDPVAPVGPIANRTAAGWRSRWPGQEIELRKTKLATVAGALLALSILGAGAVSAHSPKGHAAGTTGPAAQHTVSYSARCSAAAQGGAIHVLAKVRHGARGKSFSATATAAFTSSTPVDLRRAGRSFTAVGRIPVPADQAVGPVSVSVTITYDGVATTVTCTSRVHAAHPKADSDKDNDER
jgi:hypothetical protein